MKKIIIFLFLVFSTFAKAEWEYIKFLNEWEEVVISNRAMVCYTENKIPAKLILTWHWENKEHYSFYHLKIILDTKENIFPKGEKVTLKLKSREDEMVLHGNMTHDNAIWSVWGLDELSYLANNELKIILESSKYKKLLIFDTRNYLKHLEDLQLVNFEEWIEWSEKSD